MLTITALSESSTAGYIHPHSTSPFVSRSAKPWCGCVVVVVVVGVGVGAQQRAIRGQGSDVVSVEDQRVEGESG